jgi:hypothetical protein
LGNALSSLSLLVLLLLRLMLLLLLLLMMLTLNLMGVLSQDNELLFELPLKETSSSTISLTQIKLLKKVTVFSDGISILGEGLNIVASGCNYLKGGMGDKEKSVGNNMLV